jgi:hypothetical protein
LELLVIHIQRKWRKQYASSTVGVELRVTQAGVLVYRFTAHNRRESAAA